MTCRSDCRRERHFVMLANRVSGLRLSKPYTLRSKPFDQMSCALLLFNICKFIPAVIIMIGLLYHQPATRQTGDRTMTGPPRIVRLIFTHKIQSSYPKTLSGLPRGSRSLSGDESLGGISRDDVSQDTRDVLRETGTSPEALRGVPGVPAQIR